ncbi:hydantoinase/oxoprolinase family protein [Hansschlegelia plantiphila]|uniref:Methylhydantoinase n=1 Tax=Hansschlegelia plantiphila TaxID=374655 RepID=A0A9W6J2B8_9HYPH|nr:hydantoinase/oxoprolinase family protein [Hansschlegelia plantiphila]GLK69037.1 methylhydantoinase [Hansschlegelia plantiphila]
MRRIGVDTGGTFTDCVLVDDEAGVLLVEKVPSQPASPDAAILDGISRLIARAGLAPEDIDAVMHGTTIATNVVIEEAYAPAGVLATSGCRDVIEIGTQQRLRPYDLLHRPKPVLAPRNRRAEIAGRIAADGSEVEPLDEAAARAAIRLLVAEGSAAIAVTGLFSFMNPAHERRLVELVAEEAAGVYCIASSDVSREPREYPRFMAATVNAALAPLLDPYVRRLQHRLSDAGFRAELYIIQSSGGLATALRSMGERAHNLVLSGPAAGVVAGVVTGAMLRVRNLVTLDVGGTSADIGIVAEGEARLRFDMSLPNGLPLHVANLEIETIGAGGGSIAWIDGGGALQVGPQSAGAYPGPVCFGLGGDKPTVTDAQLVLRRLSPAGLLGGGLKLDRDAACAAVGGLAAQVGLGLEQAALGIVSVMEANMAGAILRSAARHGDNLREFTLVAAGGAGGLSAVALAKALQIPRVLIPPHPGLFSAAGLLSAELRHDLSQPMLVDAARLEVSEIEASQAELERRALRNLEIDGIPEDRRRCDHALDVRYFGQEYAVTIPTSPGEAFHEILARFHEMHEKTYGHSAPDAQVEVTAARVVGRSLADGRDLPSASHAPHGAGGRREVWFEESGCYLDTPVLERFSLRPGQTVAGPAIIEQIDATTVLPPGWSAVVDERDCIMMEEATS